MVFTSGFGENTERGRERGFISLFGWVRYKKENPSASQLAQLAPRWKGLTAGTFPFGTCELAWPEMTVMPLTVKPPCAQPSFPWLIACCHAEAASFDACLSSCLAASFGPPKYSGDNAISLLGVLSLTCPPAAQRRPTNKRPTAASCWISSEDQLLLSHSRLVVGRHPEGGPGKRAIGGSAFISLYYQKHL